MSDFNVIYEWLKNGCEALYNLWVVSSILDDRCNTIQPNSAENMYEVTAERYTDRGMKYVFTPREPYYFDVDIICYRACYKDQNDYNMDTLEEVQSVCDWLIEQQNSGNVPKFETYPCYQIECLTPRPFIRNTYEWDASPGGIIVDYAVTVRFYTKNPAKQRAMVER